MICWTEVSWYLAANSTESRGMKIPVVDDHVLIRDALRGVLKELKGEADRAGGVRLPPGDGSSSTSTPMTWVSSCSILNLPDRDGFSALAEVRERYPAISIVVLSGQQ